MILFRPEVFDRWEVAPVLLAKNVADRLGADALLTCKGGDIERLSSPPLPHVGNLLGGELSLRMLFTSQVAKIKEFRAATVDHVSRVIGCCPVIEVPRIAARRIVAMVADTEVGGAGTIYKLGSDAMRMMPDLANAETSVSMLVFGAGERPAGAHPTRGIDRSPEPINILGGQAPFATLTGSGARIGAIPSSLQNAWGEVERLAALTARRLRGIIGVHVNLTRSCAMPRVATNNAGAFACLHYTRNPHNDAEIQRIGVD